MDQSKGSCEPDCLHGDLSQSVPCCSIEYVAGEYGLNTANVSIELAGQIRMTKVVLFKNISLLTISGNSKRKPTILCKPTNPFPGIKFVNVFSLSISDVKIVGCGARHFFINSVVINVSVAITNCYNVSFADMYISRSEGTSLLIENTFGNIFLKNITIERNKLRPGGSWSTVKGGTSFASGLFVYFNTSIIASYYTITNCLFKYITTPRYKSFDARNITDIANWLGFGLGGGLAIIFSSDAAWNMVSIRNCTFQHNFAPYGAGVCIRFRENSAFNSVIIKNSTFSNCTARLAGGGLEIGSAKKSLLPNNNTVLVMYSMFKNNSAAYGAGTHVFAIPSDLTTDKGEFVNFYSCSWIENSAIYSPAIDISPARFNQHENGALPLLVFQDCNFTRNTIRFKRRTFITSGVFVITRFKVSFVGAIYFDSNVYTALLVNSGQVVFEENSHIKFFNSTGFRGGAVALHGFASLSVSNNCLVEFLNNSATEFGGAIFYYPIEQRELFEGRVCFLKYSGNRHSNISERNITFVFAGNSALVSGSSIYSTSLFSCYYAYRGNIRKHKVCEFFEEIGNFTFDGLATCPDDNSTVPAIGTAGHSFEGEHKQPLTTLPGMKIKLPILVKDELKQEVKSDFFVRIAGANTSVFLTSPYTVNTSVILNGEPNERASLVVSTQHVYRSIQYTMDVALVPCPPGYYFDGSICSCSSNNKLKAYVGIVRCNNNYSAVINRGYWAGYHPSSNMLYTAPCPLLFCVPNTLVNSEYILPRSRDDLSSFMCGPTRQGVLCGKCRDGYSTYYHSWTLTCGTNDKCEVGILFYILSELLPVFILFTVIIIFDISFSSGSRNGFIFFSQMVTILPLDYIMISRNTIAEYLYIGYSLIYGIFNIEFFTVETFSFCLFKHATVMDVLAFKYITIMFALILVILLIIFMRYCTCCGKLCASMKKKVTTKESVLNGLSAFLIICYVESVRVSFFILRLNILRGAGGVSGPFVTFFSGENYFDSNHIRYAIPAIMTLGSIAFFPPMLLLLYPTVLKLLELCKLSEHRFVIAVQRVTRINTLLPLLDVFHGHFKDHLRFFAGLYFLYRVGLLVPYSFSKNLSEYAIIGELILLLILSFHATAQPYKQNKHNIIDSLLLSNLAIITGLSIFNLKISEDVATSSFVLTAILYFQLFLIYLPVLVLGGTLSVKVCNYIRHKVRRSKADGGDQELLDYLEFVDENRDCEDEVVQVLQTSNEPSDTY